MHKVYSQIKEISIYNFFGFGFNKYCRGALSAYSLGKGYGDGYNYGYDNGNGSGAGHGCGYGTGILSKPSNNDFGGSGYGDGCGSGSGDGTITQTNFIF